MEPLTSHTLYIYICQDVHGCAQIFFCKYLQIVKYAPMQGLHACVSLCFGPYIFAYVALNSWY